jgi:Trk K+ transport system NAD-binding subunit
VLREAGIEDADMLIACAPLDETNLVACKIAHDLFNPDHASRACAAPSSPTAAR